MMGAERKSLLISEDEKERIAFHEAGHALVASLIPGADPLHKVTIVPRGRALGMTAQIPLDDRHNFSKSMLLTDIAVFLGGRAAEKIIFNDLTTGAKEDIEKATNIARRMVCEWGMSETIGPLSFGQKEEQIFLGREIAQHRDYSEQTAVLIDKEVRRIIDEASERAEKYVSENVEKLRDLASALLEREILDRGEIDTVLRGEKITTPLRNQGAGSKRAERRAEREAEREASEAAAAGKAEEAALAGAAEAGMQAKNPGAGAQETLGLEATSRESGGPDGLSDTPTQ
jgi:cell division protease FtsH